MAALLLTGGRGIRRALLAPTKLPPEGEPATRVLHPARAQPQLVRDEAALLELSEADPFEAIRLATRFLEGVAFDRVLAAALGKLSSENPAAAAEIVATLPAGDFQQIAAGRLTRALARTRPDEALAWAQSLTDNPARLRATREALGSWAETDPVAASQSVPTLKSERERILSALAVVSAWARSDAPAALAWGESFSSTEARALLLSGGVQTWAERDAGAAMRWLIARSTDPADGIGLSTMQAILGLWAVQDATAARNFITSLPAGQQPRAVEAIAPQLAQADPLGTMLWALSLENNGLCDAAFAPAFRRWRALAPVEAQQWLAAAALTPEEKSRLTDYP